MSGVILDASAILAVLLREPGADNVIAELSDAHVSTVNLGEALTRMADSSVAVKDALDQILRLQPAIHDFDQAMASSIAELRLLTKQYGLSLGDRACLALAGSLGLPVLTSDRRMAEAREVLGLDIRLIR